MSDSDSPAPETYDAFAEQFAPEEGAPGGQDFLVGSTERITVTEYALEGHSYTIQELTKHGIDGPHLIFVRRFEEDSSRVFRFTLLLLIMTTFIVFLILSAFPSPVYTGSRNTSGSPASVNLHHGHSSPPLEQKPPADAHHHHHVPPSSPPSSSDPGLAPPVDIN